jgi:MscS family membrane protein
LDRIPALQREVFGIPLWQYVASLTFILLAFYFSKILDLIVRTQLRHWATRTRTKLDDWLIGLIHGPVKIISFVILLHIGLRVLPWPVWIARWISKGLVLVVACSVTYMVLRFIDVLVGYWGTRARAREDRSFNEQLFPVINKSLKAFVVIVAVLVTSQNLGLNITAMLASLSIGGLALGLAAQDTVANLFGAVAVFVDKPFKIGDRIKLDSIDGVVESIGLRSTRVRSLDGYLVTVPNKTMGNATITNITRRPAIKTEMNIGITYDTPAEKVQRALQILKEVYRGHSMTQDLIVAFNKFADSALNIVVVHWWKGIDGKAQLQAMEEMNLAVKKRFDAEGIEFAFPTQTLYVKRDGEGALLGEQPRQAPRS